MRSPADGELSVAGTASPDLKRTVSAMLRCLHTREEGRGSQTCAHLSELDSLELLPPSIDTKLEEPPSLLLRIINFAVFMHFLIDSSERLSVSEREQPKRCRS